MMPPRRKLRVRKALYPPTPTIAGFKPDPTVLLAPGIPRSLWGVNPRTIKGQEWWFNERGKALASTGNRCYACGVEAHRTDAKRLDVHEEYEYGPGWLRYKQAIPLCIPCHLYIHIGCLVEKVKRGELPPEEALRIARRGDELVRNLPPRAVATTTTAPDQKWYLELDGVKYWGK